MTHHDRSGHGGRTTAAVDRPQPEQAALHTRMGLGRRGTPITDDSAWVFNKMADVYDARPAYPTALIDAIAQLAPSPRAHVGDLGAGIGHIALPLAQRGFQVTAVEPARAMLAQLQTHARIHGLVVETIHAAAEAIPVEAESFDVIVVADALHFLDAELTGIEVARVLDEQGTLAIITSELADTPYMNALVQLMEEAAPRRPRDTTQAIKQLAALSGLTVSEPLTFRDEVVVGLEQLQRILRSISFIGPAMNQDRFGAFWQRVTALSDAPVWTRSLTLRTARRER